MPQNSFAKKNWRNFEILTKILFAFEFKAKEEEIMITPLIKDGGKDVKFKMSFYSQLLSLPKIEIWIEAKLKSNNVEIGDIAGNVIIASNSSILSIFFVTNRYFTKQTVEELLKFKVKSGLQIILVNGFQYYNILKEHCTKVLEYISNNKKEIKDFDGFKLFVNELLEDLPTKPSKAQYEFEMKIERGNHLPPTKYSKAYREESKIELRKYDTSSIQSSHKMLNLDNIKLVPEISDSELGNNPAYQLIGKERIQLLNETLECIDKNETIILKGNSGQGKTFFANHIARNVYKKEYFVLFTDTFEQNIISLTKEIITNLIGFDYFKYLEDDKFVINYLSEFFQLEYIICEKLLELIKKDKFSETISAEICLEVLVRLLRSYRKRKKLLLIVDNLHKSTNDLLSFLKNFFGRLNSESVPVLCLSIYQKPDNIFIPENQWLQYLDSIAQSNKFATLTLPSLNNNDIFEYIRMLVPGANNNLIDFVTKNTLSDPFYIKLYINFLKSKEVIKSIDKIFWWLDDTSVLIDSQDLRCNSIDTLITYLIKTKMSNKQIKTICLILFFFNNHITQEILETIIGEIDADTLVESGLFNVELQENSLVFKFNHDLFFYNIVSSTSSEELTFTATKLLLQLKNTSESIQIERADVLGTLYQYSGNFKEAENYYSKYAYGQIELAPFKSLIFFEKALDMSLVTKNQITFPNDTEMKLIFETLRLYNKYNFLSSRKAPNLFYLLQKFDDFGQLSKSQLLNYYYFLGLKLTKEENFNDAKSYFEKAYKKLDDSSDIPHEIIDRVITSFGINLKHIGERDESLVFFEREIKRRGTQRIRYEMYSNLAAYNLTVNPNKSLEYFKIMKDELTPNRKSHLIVDIAMAYFYLKDVDLAIKYLKEAIPLSKKEINLSEEARGENIYGIIYWQKGETNASEDYLDLALSNGELANNHRWIWRIRTNLAQVALYNKKIEKAYNLSWAVINHLQKTRDSLIFEVTNSKIHSRRFAALKAITYILYQMTKKEDLHQIEEIFDFPFYTTFMNNLKEKGNVDFDKADSNLYDHNYCILG